MVSADTTTTSLPPTTPLQFARRRVRFALQRAQDGLVDIDTMDDVCCALSSAMLDLDEIDPDSSGAGGPPQMRPLVTVYEETCAVCGAKTKEALSVDRCPRTGRVRGLLCRRCHAAVDYLDGDADRARRLSDYLLAANTGEGVAR